MKDRQFHKTIFTILLVAILTALSGEIKIVPFDDITFRFGLGSIVFFLCMLIFRLPIFISGLVTAVIIVPFRALLSVMIAHETFTEQLMIHSPAVAFYITYALILHFVPLQRLKNKPLYLVLFATVSEVAANFMEQFANLILFNNSHLQLRDVAILFAVALFRSLFAIGVYSPVSLSEQKKQTAQLLSIGSSLYTESLYVKKMMEQIEEITKDSFKLHQQLRTDHPERSMDALLVAQNAHEIKKDLERIYAGLSKIVLSEQTNHYYFDDLLHLVVEANDRYSKWQQKNITIELQHTQNFATKEPFLLLSIINNIVANAIEAIEDEGTIIISSKHSQNSVAIMIENNGPPIEQTLLPIIFDAGFTTKFNKDGVASTGIGLNHVKTMCEKIGGTVSVKSGLVTTFTITIPTYKLLQ